MEEEDYCITPYSEPEEPLNCNENEELYAALPTKPKNRNLSFKGPPPPPPPPSS